MPLLLPLVLLETPAEEVPAGGTKPPPPGTTSQAKQLETLQILARTDQQQRTFCGDQLFSFAETVPSRLAQEP